MSLNSPDIPRWRIGEAAKRSGIAAANIRYYEKEQLLSPGVREDNQYRLYTDGDVHRLRAIATRCFSPPDSFNPRSPIVESYPCAKREMNPCALARLATCSI